jgi:hypothetical protein
MHAGGLQVSAAGAAALRLALFLFLLLPFALCSFFLSYGWCVFLCSCCPSLSCSLLPQLWLVRAFAHYRCFRRTSVSVSAGAFRVSVSAGALAHAYTAPCRLCRLWGGVVGRERNGNCAAEDGTTTHSAEDGTNARNAERMTLFVIDSC